MPIKTETPGNVDWLLRLRDVITEKEYAELWQPLNRARSEARKSGATQREVDRAIARASEKVRADYLAKREPEPGLIEPIEPDFPAIADRERRSRAAKKGWITRRKNEARKRREHQRRSRAARRGLKKKVSAKRPAGKKRPRLRKRHPRKRK